MNILIDSVKSKLLIGGTDNLVDPKLITHIREYMSIDVPGSFFARKHMKFHWDGRKYFVTEKGAFATGFLPLLLRFIDEEYPDLEVKIMDNREYIPQFKENFVNRIGPIEINEEYTHQKAAIQSLNHHIKFRDYNIYFPQGVFDISTNGGKTAIIAGAYLNLQSPGKMLVIIHRKPIFRQLVEFFEQVFDDVGQINDQNYKIGKQVTIAMIHTLYRRIDQATVLKDLAQMRVLACDECHLSGANMFAKVLTHCNASIKVGTSGTSFDSDNIVNKMISVGLLGPKLITVSKKELMDKGISTPIKIHMMLCNTVLYAPVLDYNECIQKLIYESAERVQLIADIIKERRTVGPILIAVDKTKHGQFLKHSLEDNHKIQIELTHSKDPDIEDKIDMFREGEIDVLVSTSVLREGVNLPLIQTIIYASGGAAKVSVKQWCGRGERLDESKTEVLFFDFFDIGHYVSNHSKKRIKIYNDEQLEVTYHYNTSDVKNMRPVVIK